MSAFICNDYHISLLASYACNKRLSCVNGLDAEQVGKILYAENLASVNYRYHDTPDAQDCFKFDDRAQQANPNAVTVLKAANCLSYQSCEHDGWDKSQAHKIVEAIISNAIYSLPGYQEAQWEIAEPVKVRAAA